MTRKTNTLMTTKARAPIEQMLLTIPQVAQSLNLGRTKVYDLINHAGLPTVKLGSAIRVPLNSLKQWLEQREQENRSA